jgi:uncharacterized membrane protein YuzA (DUF378 family)
MKVLRYIQLLAQFLVFLGALSVGALGMFKVDVFSVLVAKSSLKYLQISIGIAAMFLIILRFL